MEAYTDKPDVANPIYRVARWNETFETNESRKLKSLNWVSFPVDFQSNGYQMMVDHFSDEAPAMYGAWTALVVVAAKCPVRGTLAAQNGAAYTLERIARLSYLPIDPFRKLAPWALSKTVGWLEVVSPREIAGAPPGDRREKPPSTEPDRTGQDKQNNPTTEGGGGLILDESTYAELYPAVRDLLEKIGDKKPRQQDARLLLVCLMLSKFSLLERGCVSDAVAQVAETRNVEKPWGFFNKKIQAHCRSAGLVLSDEINTAKIPRRLLKLPPPNGVAT